MRKAKKIESCCDMLFDYYLCKETGKLKGKGLLSGRKIQNKTHLKKSANREAVRILLISTIYYKIRRLSGIIDFWFTMIIPVGGFFIVVFAMGRFENEKINFFVKCIKSC